MSCALGSLHHFAGLVHGFVNKIIKLQTYISMLGLTMIYRYITIYLLTSKQLLAHISARGIKQPFIRLSTLLVYPWAGSRVKKADKLRRIHPDFTNSSLMRTGGTECLLTTNIGTLSVYRLQVTHDIMDLVRAFSPYHKRTILLGSCVNPFTWCPDRH